jgi:hypothetical protein
MAKGKVNLSPADITSKWGSRLQGAVSDIQKGIDSVTENPLEQAAAKKDKMLAKINEAVTNGKWEAGLKSVSLSDWKTTTKNKVASRLASGVQEATAKRQKFDTYLVNTLNAVLPTIKSMPDLTIEDSVNRVRTLITHMKNNPYRK